MGSENAGIRVDLVTKQGPTHNAPAAALAEAMAPIYIGLIVRIRERQKIGIDDICTAVLDVVDDVNAEFFYTCVPALVGREKANAIVEHLCVEGRLAPTAGCLIGVCRFSLGERIGAAGVARGAGRRAVRCIELGLRRERLVARGQRSARVEVTVVAQVVFNRKVVVIEVSIAQRLAIPVPPNAQSV